MSTLSRGNLETPGWIQTPPPNTYVVIESKCKQCDHTHSGRQNRLSSPFGMIRDCGYLMQQLGSPLLSHITRESNKCADLLARNAHDQQESFFVYPLYAGLFVYPLYAGPY